MNIIFKPECKTEIIKPTYDLPIIGEPISKTGASANNSNAYGVIVGIIGDGSSRRVRVMTEGYIDYDKVKENYMEYTDEAIKALTGITLCSGGKLPSGYDTTASGVHSHAEGYRTTASGNSSHAEGAFTKASGNASHAEGAFTTASGDYSHAEGYRTTASGKYSHAEGEYNIEDTANKYAHIIGNGTSNSKRHNCFMVGWDGAIYVQASDDATKMMKLTIKSDGTISAVQATV